MPKVVNGEIRVGLKLPVELIDFFRAEGKKWGISTPGTYIKSVLIQYKNKKEEADGKRSAKTR